MAAKPGRAVAASSVALIVLLLGWDLSREPTEQWSVAPLTGALECYQRTLSPILAAGGVRCRFQPTCSRYAVMVIQRDGALVGSWRAVTRLLRCGPWTPPGTEDLPEPRGSDGIS